MPCYTMTQLMDVDNMDLWKMFVPPRLRMLCHEPTARIEVELTDDADEGSWRVREAVTSYSSSRLRQPSSHYHAGRSARNVHLPV